MATDKEKMMKGFVFLAVGFPFIFMGPGLFAWLGIPGYRNGEYAWFVVSIVFMLIAAYFAVKGLRYVISSFFDSKS